MRAGGKTTPIVLSGVQSRDNAAAHFIGNRTAPTLAMQAVWAEVQYVRGREQDVDGERHARVRARVRVDHMELQEATEGMQLLLDPTGAFADPTEIETFDIIAVTRDRIGRGDTMVEVERVVDGRGV